MNFNFFERLPGRRQSQIVFAVLALGWSLTLIYSSISGRSLYGDGSYILLRILSNPSRFFNPDDQRAFAYVISQAPVLFGQKLAFESVAAYAALYSLGVFGIPAITMSVALFLARRQPILFTVNVLAILVYGFSVNFINTEANLLFGFVWLSVTLLALRGTAPILRGFALPALAFALMRTYEGMLLVGPVLALWAVIAARRTEEHLERIGLLIAALLFSLGSIIGAGGFLSPRDSGNASSFLFSAFAYLRSPQVLLLLSSVCAVLGVFLPNRRLRFLGIAASAMMGAGFLLMMLRVDGFYSFSFYYYNRSFLVLFLPVLVGGLFAAYWLRPAWFTLAKGNTRHLFLLVPVGMALAGDAIGTHRWNTYTQQFCKTLEMDLLPAQRIAVLKDTGSRTAWSWTHPTLSVLLRDRGSVAMVHNEPGASAWEPFKPENAPTIPYLGLCQAPLLGPARLDSFLIPVSFGNARYPSYVESVRGLSKPEGWATWSDGPVVEFRFARPLPSSFDLSLRIGSAFGANKRSSVKVRAGSRELEFVADREPTDVDLQFREVAGANVLTFHIPKPESPVETGAGADPRMLGLAFVTLKITPK